MERAEQSQPWVIYTFGRTHDRWWPLWSSTRVLGRARIGLECCVCGATEVVSLRIPRLGKVPEPAGGRHAERERFLAEHIHPDRGHPMSWKRPLRNMNVFGPDGLNPDLLAMRIQTDLNEELP
jgi:hypothetical protein